MNERQEGSQQKELCAIGVQAEQRPCQTAPAELPGYEPVLDILSHHPAHEARSRLPPRARPDAERVAREAAENRAEANAYAAEFRSRRRAPDF
jgi:hypothetical protein